MLSRTSFRTLRKRGRITLPMRESYSTPEVYFNNLQEEDFASRVISRDEMLRVERYTTFPENKFNEYITEVEYTLREEEA